MVSILIAALVSALVAYMVLNKYKAQYVLFMGGMLLLAIAILMNMGPLLAKGSSGFIWFDIFKFMESTFSERVAGLGFQIMSIAGFSRFMDKIGASKALVKLCIKPLRYVRAPYVVLALSLLVGQLLSFCIPSAAGLGLLLMVTMFPILLGLGVSRASATAVIATTYCIAIGPASANGILAAKVLQMDVAVYFVKYQLPVAFVAVPTLAIMHYFVQQWFDKKEGHDVALAAAQYQSAPAASIEKAEKEEEEPPAIYAILPIIPLVIIMAFSSLFSAKIRVGVPSAMFMGLFIAIVFECIRYSGAKKVFSNGQNYFDGMGKAFADIVTLIVAGETFAYGLTKIGAIDTLIAAARSAGFGVEAMTILMTGIISVASVLMGSGNAPFFAFAALAPTVATLIGAEAVLMMLPMQLASSIMRAASPITAVVVATSGIANISPFEVAKRTAVPLVVTLIVTVGATFVLF